MMPFSSYSYSNYRRYPNYYKQSLPETSPKVEEMSATPTDTRNSNNVNTVVSDSETRSINEAPMFEIFGIKLYFDDILLVCLLLFLYEEGADDPWLFISLILLLLS